MFHGCLQKYPSRPDADITILFKSFGESAASGIGAAGEADGFTPGVVFDGESVGVAE